MKKMKIPYYSLHNCIEDSGADDMEYFPKDFIEEDYE